MRNHDHRSTGQRQQRGERGDRARGAPARTVKTPTLSEATERGPHERTLRRAAPTHDTPQPRRSAPRHFVGTTTPRTLGYGGSGAFDAQPWRPAEVDDTEPGSDSELAQRVRHALGFTHSMHAPNDLVIEVERRVVTLEGSVRSPAARQRLAELAAQVPGVREVRNALVVRHRGH